VGGAIILSICKPAVPEKTSPMPADKVQLENKGYEFTG
jgi:hypothetical protein